MRMQIGYQSSIGTTMQLDTLRRMPDTAQCVNYALQGDIEGLRYLFSDSLASPRDVSATRGLFGPPMGSLWIAVQNL